jgi:predicted O-linked N-acetylglucosamine transferase (SPINDLY family)
MSSPRNSPCPCGSGKKYKHCHGAPGSTLSASAAGSARPASRSPANQGRAAALVQAALKHHQSGDFDHAETLYRQAVAADPLNAQALNQLGSLLFQRGRLADGERLLRAAIDANPGLASAYSNLGAVLKSAGRLEEAAEVLGKAVAMRPGFAAALANLGGVFTDLGRLDEGEATLRRALAVEPRLVDAHINLGVVLRRRGRADAAVAALDAALAINPRSAEAHYNRAMVLRALGLVTESVAAWRQVLALPGAMPEAHSNLLLTVHYSDALDAGTIFAEHRAYDAAHAKTLAPPTPAYHNVPDPARRLRVGYVSPDFRRHSVACFIEPVLEQHDRGGFEIACYYNNSHEDEITARLKEHAGLWTNCARMSDEELARKIAADRIDVLVDLAGHTGGRMLAFARKPAPVQATWLGYPTGTGLSAMDYRITDGKADPDGYEAMSAERLVRLPDSYFCYRPQDASPEAVSTTPPRAGRVVFGSFNHIAKITTATLELWARVLRAVPESKLLLKAQGFSSESARQRVRGCFAGLGIDAARIDLRGWEEATAAHLAIYRQVDIGLDTTPYNGATTTCEALWMGVPVISLAGRRPESRMGLSILSAAGFQEWGAHSEDEFVSIATRLAGDAQLRQRLRDDMRDTLHASPLLDGLRFTRHLEAAYRRMWATWCAGQAAVSA